MVKGGNSLSNVFGVIQNVFDLLKSFVLFIVEFLQDVVYVASLLPSLVADITSVITAFIPAPVLGLILGLLSITVLYKVLGRD